eukprot:4511249-Prymnesium_polylepis.1
MPVARCGSVDLVTSGTHLWKVPGSLRHAPTRSTLGMSLGLAFSSAANLSKNFSASSGQGDGLASFSACATSMALKRDARPKGRPSWRRGAASLQ